MLGDTRLSRNGMTASGPKRPFTAAQQDVCNGAQTGQSTDEARTAAFDLVDGARFRHRGVP